MGLGYLSGATSMLLQAGLKPELSQGGENKYKQITSIGN